MVLLQMALVLVLVLVLVLWTRWPRASGEPAGGRRRHSHIRPHHTFGSRGMATQEKVWEEINGPISHAWPL